MAEVATQAGVHQAEGKGTRLFISCGSQAQQVHSRGLCKYLPKGNTTPTNPLCPTEDEETSRLRHSIQCNSIHRTITEQFKTAIVYGKSVKHQPQRVGLAHELADEDVGKWLFLLCSGGPSAGVEKQGSTWASMGCPFAVSCRACSSSRLSRWPLTFCINGSTLAGHANLVQLPLSNDEQRECKLRGFNPRRRRFQVGLA